MGFEQTLKLVITLRRIYCMTKATMGLVKGIGTGLAAGAMVGFVSSQMMKNPKQAKKKAHKAMHTMSDLLDNVQDMFR